MSNHVLKIREVAQYLSVSESTIYKMVKQGEIPAVRIGKSWLFLQPVIDKWLEEAMSKNVSQEIDKLEKVEFIPHELGRIKGDLSREEIYRDR
jgi:PTS system nitrogen regulatory IIA component